MQTTLHSIKKNLWVVDSGFSHHMIGNKSNFIFYENYLGGAVRFGNYHCIHIVGKGIVLLDNETPIHDVYYLEGLTHNFLSLRQLCDNGFHVLFNSLGCEIRKKYGKTIAVDFRTTGNIYNLYERTNNKKGNKCLFYESN